MSHPNFCAPSTAGVGHFLQENSQQVLPQVCQNSLNTFEKWFHSVWSLNQRRCGIFCSGANFSSLFTCVGHSRKNQLESFQNKCSDWSVQQQQSKNMTTNNNNQSLQKFWRSSSAINSYTVSFLKEPFKAPSFLSMYCPVRQVLFLVLVAFCWSWSQTERKK